MKNLFLIFILSISFNALSQTKQDKVGLWTTERCKLMLNTDGTGHITIFARDGEYLHLKSGKKYQITWSDNSFEIDLETGKKEYCTLVFRELDYGYCVIPVLNIPDSLPCMKKTK
jgi:hypothetical protein